MPSPSGQEPDSGGPDTPGQGPKPFPDTPGQGPKPFPDTPGAGRTPRPDPPPAVSRPRIPQTKPAAADPAGQQPGGGAAKAAGEKAAAGGAAAAKKIPGVKKAAAIGAAAKTAGKAFTKDGRHELAGKGRDAARLAGGAAKQKAKTAAKAAAKTVAKKATKQAVKRGAQLAAAKLAACVASLVCGIILAAAVLLVLLFVALSVVVVFAGGVDVNLDAVDPAERVAVVPGDRRERIADPGSLAEAWNLSHRRGPDPVAVLDRWVRVGSPPGSLLTTVETHNNPGLACERLFAGYDPHPDDDLDTEELILEEFEATAATQTCNQWWAAAVAWSHTLREASHGMNDDAVASLLDIDSLSDDPILDLLIAATDPEPPEHGSAAGTGAAAAVLPYDLAHSHDAAAAMVVALWSASGFATLDDPTDGFVQLYYGSLAKTDDDTYRRYRHARAGHAATISLEDSADLVDRAAALAAGRARENEAKHRAAIVGYNTYIGLITDAMLDLLISTQHYETAEAEAAARDFYRANIDVMLADLAEAARRRDSSVEPVQDFGCCEAGFLRPPEDPLLPPLDRPPPLEMWPPYCGDPGGLNQLPPSEPSPAAEAALEAAAGDETLAALLSDKVLMAVECQMPPSLDLCWLRPAESSHWEADTLAEELPPWCAQIKEAEEQHTESGLPGWLVWNAKWDRNQTLGSTINECVPGYMPDTAVGAWVLTFCAHRVWVGQAGHPVIAYGVYHADGGWTPPPPRPPTFGQLLASVINHTANLDANVALAQHAFALANLNGWAPEYAISDSQRRALLEGDPGDAGCLRLFRVLGSGAPDSNDPATRPYEDPQECHKPTLTQMMLWGWGPPRAAACPDPEPLTRFSAGEVVVTDLSVDLPSASGQVITVAPCMAPAMIRLYDLALSMSVPLPVVSSYRSWEEQADKHQHFTAAGGAAAGLPPVAQPGHSRHNMGLALDFACNIAMRDTNGDGNATEPVMPLCWRWLDYYAYRFGLINFPVEEWHWSTDGG